MKIDRTPQFDEALRLMDGATPFVFITGRAGTGKSTLLRYYRDHTKRAVPVLAPTGVAALNVEGETIHRFFRFPPGITLNDARKKGVLAGKEKLYSKINAIIIDEISMMRADLMDCIDVFLRAARKDGRPFGGVRIVAIGDLYQLPPVVTSSDREAFSRLYESPYFFASHAVKGIIESHDLAFIELEKVYRQTDDSFIAILNAVRNRSVTEDDLVVLNQRVNSEQRISDAIILTPTNEAADTLNADRLARLAWRERIFKATVSGDFPEREAPTDFALCLKRGARVMCVVNDPGGRYVNGSLGWVRGMGEESVRVEFDDGGTHEIEFYTWTVYRSVYDRKQSELSQERVGSFTQIPLRLAWAITIHKSQGKTFDRAVIDMGRGAFAAGQTYVALSRCRSLPGLSLVKPITIGQIRLDYSIVKFLTSLQYSLAEEGLSLDEKIALLRQAVKEKTKFEIVYLKAQDVKSRRIVIPLSIELAEYAGHEFLALRAHCLLRGEERTFNVERILEIRESGAK